MAALLRGECESASHLAFLFDSVGLFVSPHSSITCQRLFAGIARESNGVSDAVCLECLSPAPAGIMRLPFPWAITSTSGRGARSRIHDPREHRASSRGLPVFGLISEW